ncbi:LPXTG cell wall anchor domain-containing protein [Actinokineospora guangxiensis]|uniref:LPXTG cell wall anchor domain-containing protein n=1 Tax=Actinokineospora guangxiensis TaxID=1490288 RepID=A0ABW0ELT2_9PSEU
MRLTRTLVPLAVTLVVAAGGASPAAAVDHSKGHPGFCKNATGVTVVIDFQQLGGTTIVRCNPRSTRGTGLDALKGAGLQIAGVQRWGEAFICRIENRPSAVEVIPVEGKGDYREHCVDTPPAGGYWSYWHSGNNCAWDYSQWGVKNRDFVPGGFEGWSFSLNATADSNPVPRIAPVRPGTEGGPCVTRPEAKPETDDPNEQAPVAPPPAPVPTEATEPGQEPEPGGAQDPGDPPTTTSPGQKPSAALPPPKPRPRADPADNVAFTGGESMRDVNEVIKEQSGASDVAPWIAAAGVLALLGGAVVVSRRRKRES